MITIQPGCKVILKEQFVDSLYCKRGIVVNCSKDSLTLVNPKETVYVLWEDGNKAEHYIETIFHYYKIVESSLKSFL